MFKLEIDKSNNTIEVKNINNENVATIKMNDKKLIVLIKELEMSFSEFKQLEHQIDMACSHVRINETNKTRNINNLN